MTTESRTTLLAHIDDDDTNPSHNPSFASVLEARMSRRTLLKGSMGLAAGTFFGGSLMACADDDVTPPPAPQLRLDFTAVGKSLADAVVVPAGYTASVLFRLGDPIAAGVADYTNNGSEPGASHALRAGDHHDAIYYFGMGSGGTYSPATSDRGLLVMNHEAITPLFLHVNGPTIVNGARTVNDEVIKELNAHGVSIIEVSKAGSTVAYNKSSPYNRRITTNTEMILSGPVARTPAMVTKYSTDGSRTRGTVNNCANGYTPWGTYLTCEENWAGYFRRVTATDNPKRSAKELASFSRYGVAGNGRELWATAVAADAADTTFSRWNAEKLGASADGSDDFRNVANTYGWVVEIDPFATDVDAEEAHCPRALRARRRVDRPGHCRQAAGVLLGRRLPQRVHLQVRFHRQLGRGRRQHAASRPATSTWTTASSTWPGSTRTAPASGWSFASAERHHRRQSGLRIRGPGRRADQHPPRRRCGGRDADGPSRMGRGEPDERRHLHDPHQQHQRAAHARGDRCGQPALLQRPDDALARPNGQPQRAHHPHARGRRQPRGHHVRLGHLSVRRALDRDPGQHQHLGLTADNDFSSPDGLWFGSSRGMLWIQTDDGAYTDVTNCMMLAAMPGPVGDGGKKTITNVDGATSQDRGHVRRARRGRRTLRRFLVGPNGCEITGIVETPDGKAIFVNIQHPGERTSAANLAAGNYPATGRRTAPPARVRPPSSSPRTTAARSAADSPDRAAHDRHPPCGGPASAGGACC